MRALITGMSGFVGGWLAEHLLAEGWEVAGTFRSAPPAWLATIPARAIQLDASDLEQTRRVLQAEQPEVVFHLAGQSNVAQAWRDPGTTLFTNIQAQLNVMEALPDLRATTVVVASSAQVYGAARPDQMPLGEDAPLAPADPYATSKVAQEFLALQYHRSRGARVVVLRAFNQIGPRQRPSFVVPDFARQVAEIEQGLREPLISVGTLAARRDFTDARDMVRAYRLAAEQGEPGAVYNVGSGVAIEIGQILDRLVSMARVPVQISVDPERVRDLEVPVLQCDRSRFSARTSWEPTIELDETLADTLEYWRERVASSSPAPAGGGA